MKNQLKFSLVATVALTAFTTNLYAANIGGTAMIIGSDSFYVNNSHINGNVIYDTGLSNQYVAGGWSESKENVELNAVTILGNAGSAGVYGGYLSNAANPGQNLEIRNNIVTINTTGQINHVYGGYSKPSQISTNRIYDNTVVFLQGTILTSLYGGYAENNSVQIYRNTLSVGSASQAVNLNQTRQVRNLGNFSTINFYLPANVSSTSKILTATGSVNLTNTTTINTYIAANPTNLLTGQNTITLINATGGSITGWTQGTSQTATLRIGSVLQTTPNVSVSGSNLNLSFDFTPGGGGGGGSTVVVVNDAAKSISETRITQSQMVNLATDFIVDKVQNSLKPVDDLQSFGYMGGAIMKYDSGSHIDANGVNVNVGLGKNYDDFSFGGFLEYGFSTYESVVGNVEADGQSHLYGLGLFAKQMFSNKFYLASSIHGGLVESDYSRKDMDSTYDTRSPYVGLDLGMGKLVALGKNQNIDLYAKYLFGFVASDDVTLSTGEEYKFEAVKSHRAKAGLKFNQTIRNFNFIYAGLGTQYEFSNESRASFRSGPLSEDAPRPTLKGVSGIGEVGYRFRPTGDLSFEIGGKYYIGKMQGLSGNAGFQYRF